MKTKRVLSEVSELLPDAEKTGSQFCTGWLWRFQKRRNLKSRKPYGEDEDADGKAAEKGLPKLRALYQQFALAKKRNAGEKALNFAMPPDRTTTQNALTGRKKDKKRMTILVCSNADGSEKVLFLTTANAQRPR